MQATEPSPSGGSTRFAQFDYRPAYIWLNAVVVSLGPLSRIVPVVLTAVIVYLNAVGKYPMLRLACAKACMCPTRILIFSLITLLVISSGSSALSGETLLMAHTTCYHVI